MPREKPLYHDTLSSVRARATELFPGELLFGPTKVAKILGPQPRAGYGGTTAVFQQHDRRGRSQA